MAEQNDYDKNDKSVFLRLVVSGLRKKWAQVDNIGTADLHRLMDNLERGDQPEDQLNVNIPKHLIILDTRPEEEYCVSHLKSSRRVSSEATDIKDTLGSIRELQEKDQELQSRTSVFNLEGSIFKWANEARPMLNNLDQSTIYAHPYNFMWGKALSKELRRTAPET